MPNARAWKRNCRSHNHGGHSQRPAPFYGGGRKLRKMFFRVAIGTQQKAFSRLSCDHGRAAIRQRPQIELESFGLGIDMMKRECGMVALVPTSNTATPVLLYQRDFAFHATRLLSQIALVMVIGIFVLAIAAAVFGLPALKGFLADHAARSLQHMHAIIIQRERSMRHRTIAAIPSWGAPASIPAHQRPALLPCTLVRAYSTTVSAGDSSKGGAVE